jgi:hypothetical protein
MFRHAFLSAAILLTATITPAASQQQQPACTKRSDVVDHLAGKYKEAPVAIGLANNGGVVEVLSSQSGASWTIIITMPNGTACMVAAGENWEKVPTVAILEPTT